jgi:hypothetical protein
VHLPNGHDKLFVRKVRSRCRCWRGYPNPGASFMTDKCRTDQAHELWLTARKRQRCLFAIICAILEKVTLTVTAKLAEPSSAADQRNQKSVSINVKAEALGKFKLC